MRWRHPSLDDIEILVDLNRQLQQDEGATVMNPAALRRRLAKWLANGYQAIVFEKGGELVAYALFRDTDPDAEGPESIYLRQFFVVRERRRSGIGRQAFAMLRDEVWPRDRRVILEALSANPAAHAFWQALGFAPYSVTYELPAAPRRG